MASAAHRCAAEHRLRITALGHTSKEETKLLDYKNQLAGNNCCLFCENYTKPINTLSAKCRVVEC
jgi:hypothetical protein